MNSEEKRVVYANEKQQKFLRSRARRKGFVGGRGSGKSHVLGYCIGQAFRTMPRAKFALAGLTYVQLDLVVLPVVREAMMFMGIHEFSKTNPYGCYVIGVRPPETWAKPWKPIGKLGYQYCMSFINGFTLQFVSQDHPVTSRGLNIDGLLNDESFTMAEDFISKILRPAIRANEDKKFAKSNLFHCDYSFSSASWTTSGNHIYKIEELYKLEQEERRNYTQDQLKDTPPKYLYLESTCLDNPITGEKYMLRMKEELTDIEFQVEVMNQRLLTHPDGFYYAFNMSKHTYWNQQRYEADDKTGLVLMRPTDYRDDKSIDLTLDFNAAICWCLVCQEVGMEWRVINSTYTKPTIQSANSNIVVQTANWFINKYKDHKKKEAYIYGDPGGNSKSASTSLENLPFFDQFCEVLVRNGWKVFRRELTSYPRHRDKYLLSNLILEEQSERTPKLRINQNTNKALLIAIQATRIKDNDKYEKDKSSESKEKNREFATDGTDALDYWLWAKGKRFLPNREGFRNQHYSPKRT